MNSVYDICDYGACADGRTVNTSAIQRAIDACHTAGGGRVVCGPGEFLIGSLQLKSRVDLYLSIGCRLVGSTNLADYADLIAPGFRHELAPEKSSKSLLLAIDAEDFSITGPGEISFSDFRIKSGQPIRIQGSPETCIRNVSFSNVAIETTGEDAVICRHCVGIKFNNVELSNRPMG